MTAEELRAYESGGEGNVDCSVIEFRFKKNPKNHWAAPFVTGHTYYMRWDYGVDVEAMDVEIIEPLWNDPRDKDIKFEHPSYDVREAIYVCHTFQQTSVIIRIRKFCPQLQA